MDECSTLLRLLTMGWVCVAATGCVTRLPAPPAETGKWRLAEHPVRVSPGNIFDYMDGAGELYLAFNFRQMSAWRMAAPDHGKILVEVYEMGSAEDAYGVVSTDLEGEKVDVGSLGLYEQGLLRFCKGRYFARILADRDSPESRRAVLDAGRHIASQIAEEGGRPDLLEMLPKEGLVAASVHYFHTKMCLNYFYFLGEENLLDLSLRTQAVMADYRRSGASHKLLIVRYPGNADARKAWNGFRKNYLRERPGAATECVSTQVEAGNWAGGTLRGRHVILVFEAPTKAVCESVLSEASRHVKHGG